MKILNYVVVAIIVLGTIGIIIYQINNDNISTYSTTNTTQRDISKVINIPGNVYPIKEIEVKSQLSGILEDIYVKIGENVITGTPIASIRFVSSISEIERLENSVNNAQIEYNARLMEYERANKLFTAKVIHASEFEGIEKVFLQSKEQLTSSKNQLDIVKTGRIESKRISNIVNSTTSGVVIDIPVDVGASITERNNYASGTTLAIVAEMDKFEFEAPIAEHYLQYINIGDTIFITFNAYNDIKSHAIVTKISSKGISSNGIMKYMLNAEFDITPEMPMLRSGYSASGEIVLLRKNSVISIEENYINYNNDSIYVKVLDTINNSVKRKLIVTGISDGVFTEIISGVGQTDKIIIK